jgi:hypothetical protein
MSHRGFWSFLCLPVCTDSSTLRATCLGDKISGKPGGWVVISIQVRSRVQDRVVVYFRCQYFIPVHGLHISCPECRYICVVSRCRLLCISSVIQQASLNPGSHNHTVLPCAASIGVWPRFSQPQAVKHVQNVKVENFPPSLNHLPFQLSPRVPPRFEHQVRTIMRRHENIANLVLPWRAPRAVAICLACA